MRGKQHLLALLLIFISQVLAWSQEKITTIDLSKEWLMFQNGDYVTYDKGAHPASIYFSLSSRSPEDTLVITSPIAFSIYVNHQLISNFKNELIVRLGTLLQHHASPWLITVHQTGGIDRLYTSIILGHPLIQEPNTLRSRSRNYFMDFCIIGSIMLLVFLVTLIYTNGHLAYDYFNFLKLFSIQEREDSLLNSRISASANVLFYVFASLLGAFVLLIIFHNTQDELGIAKYFQVKSFGYGFLTWSLLALIIFGLLVIKLIIVAMATSLFNWKDHLPIHYFNFIRLTFFIFSLDALLCLIFFVFGIGSSSAFSFLANTIIYCMLFWIIIVALKLLGRVTHSFFHLFSYLCASELIPVMITIKVLLS